MTFQARMRQWMQDPKAALGITIVRDEQGAITQMIKVLESQASVKPLIVHVEDLNQFYVKAIYSTAKKFGVSVTSISSDYEAARERKLLLGSNSGIIILGHEFTRGLDIRFGLAPYVVTVINQGNMALTDLEQVFGRGSRSQGTCEKEAIIIDAQESDGMMAIKKLGLDHRLAMEQAVPNLQPLFAKASKVQKTFQYAFEQIYQQNGWKIPASEFNIANKNNLRGLLDSI